MRRRVPSLRSTLRRALLAAALVATGCGFRPSPFAGGYQITDGGETLVCDGGTLTEAISGPVVIIDEGAGGDTMEVSIGGETLHYGVVNNTLHFIDNTPPETETDDAGFAQVVNPTDVRLATDTLTLDGDTLTESGSGTTDDSLNSLDDLTCNFTRWFVATRDKP